MTKLPASVGIATTGDVGMTGGNRGAMIAGILAAVAVAVERGAVTSARSVAVVAEIAIGVSAAADVTGIAIPDRVNCRSRRKACG